MGEQFQLHMTNDEDMLAYVMDTCSLMLSLQQLSFVIVAVCLILIPAASLAVLFEEIPVKESGLIGDKVRAAKWKKNYLLVSDAVGDLNDFLGQPVLIFIACTFVSFACCSSFIASMLMSTKTISYSVLALYLYAMFRNVICITVLAVASEKIRSEVSCKIEIYPQSQTSIQINQISTGGGGFKSTRAPPSFN